MTVNVLNNHLQTADRGWSSSIIQNDVQNLRESVMNTVMNLMVP